MAKTQSAEAKEIQVIQLGRGEQDFYILGATPLIYNAPSFKMKTEGATGLLMPESRKRQGTVRKEPWKEFRESVYRHRSANTLTHLMLPARMFKGAMRSVTARLSGLFGTEVGQLIWVSPEEVSIFGVPQIFTAMVRDAGINRTPDMRTRAIVPEWACRLRVSYVLPNIKAPAVVNLLGNAGLLCGVGDFRAEKGKGNFGQFTLVDENDPDFNRILTEGGREAQEAALADPLYYDAETEEILSWYIEERRRRDGSYSTVEAA